MTPNPFFESSTPDIDDRSIPGFHYRKFDEHFSDEAGISGMSLRSISNRRRLQVLLTASFLLIGVLSFRLVHLQLITGWIHRASAEENRTAIRDIPAPRGLIYDRNFQPLVRNVPTFSLSLVPSKLPEVIGDRDIIIARLASSLSVTEEELRTKIDSVSDDYVDPVVVLERLDYDRAMQLFLDLRDLPSVVLDVRGKRQYLGGSSFSHLLGYTGKLNEEEYTTYGAQGYGKNEEMGKTGLELSYETELRGTNGKRRAEVDVLEQEQKIIAETAPVPGVDLILGIDQRLQQTLQTSLEHAVQESNGTGGAAVAVDPRSGEIRAMVNVPTYDDNLFVNGISEVDYEKLKTDERHPLFPRAWAGVFPSGSTIKPLWAAAALTEGTITRSTTVLSTGGISVGPWNFPDWKAGGHGRVGLIEAMGWSVNTYFYAIAGGFESIRGLGVEKLHEYGERFGLNHPLGIDLPSEASGFLPTPDWKQQEKDEPWYIGDTYHLGIGQGDLLVTPLQMAMATSAIANGGTLYQPRVVSRLRTPNGEFQMKPVVLKEQIIPASHLATVREGMRYTVTQGSGKGLQQVPVPVAAKTGTAQVDTTSPTHAWLTSFAPYENPEIAIVILIEHGGQGSQVALPVAQEFYRAYFSSPAP